MSNDVVFVSYYTPNYKKWVDNLRDSLGKQHLKYDLVPIAHKTSEKDGKEKWQANVRYKPQFILDMLKKHSDARAVVWVDADAIVGQKPTLFTKMREDLGVCFKPFPNKRMPSKYELLSGTVFVRNTPNAIRMMELWVEAMPYVKEQKKKMRQPQLLKPEQQVLQALLTVWKCIPKKLYNNADGLLAILTGRERCKVSVKDIPETYCHIQSSVGDVSCVVNHQQASREMRNPERSARLRAMRAANGHRSPFVRLRKKKKPASLKKNSKTKGRPSSRRRRRRMG